MKKQLTKNKLVVDREIVRSLTEVDLRRVDGGRPPSQTMWCDSARTECAFGRPDAG
jgi:hypothetical protein